MNRSELSAVGGINVSIDNKSRLNSFFLVYIPYNIFLDPRLTSQDKKRLSSQEVQLFFLLFFKKKSTLLCGNHIAKILGWVLRGEEGREHSKFSFKGGQPTKLE